MNFVDDESFLESNSLDVLALLCETNLDDSIDSANFAIRGFLPLIRKVLVLICMVLQFMQKKTLQILFYVLDCLYFTQCLTFFSSIGHLLHLYAWFLILFHLT